MTTENQTQTAATEAKKDNWPQRFGTLVDVTDRESVKGPYITFKGQGNGFEFYGACFDEKIIAEMKAAVGKRVWMKGPLETRMVNGEEKKSFKVVYFRVSEAQAGESVAAAEAAEEAA